MTSIMKGKVSFNEKIDSSSQDNFDELFNDVIVKLDIFNYQIKKIGMSLGQILSKSVW